MTVATEKETITLVHERVDDVPLILGMITRLQWPQILERHLGTHGHQQGLSNGWLAAVWLAYILNQGDHCKSKVEEWAEQHRHCIESFTGQELRPGEFNDDRLGVVLRRLSRPERWEAIEQELWESTVAVYELQPEAVRLDSTSSFGYHRIEQGGLMQRGQSKDHRPDLPQIKLMAAAAQPGGQLLASEVHPGQAADDPLYLPLIERVRKMLGAAGSMLYVGDSKMAALRTRANIARAKDWYLVPLPLTGKTAQHFRDWVDAAVSATSASGPEARRLQERGVELLWDEDKELLGAGYELSRKMRVKLEGRSFGWTERVLVVRSMPLAQSQEQALQERLQKAEQQLLALTPAPGPGRQQVREEQSLRQAIDTVLERHKLGGLLQVHFERQETVRSHLHGPGRPGPNRALRQEVQVRYQITSVERNEEAIEQRVWRLGWRAYATNASRKQLALAEAVKQYRAGWSLERDFHLVKDLPLGISPLYVRNEDQIQGLTHLLMLALRLLTLLELMVREGLGKNNEQLSGLYEGNPNRKTAQPTGLRLLRAIARAELTLTHVQIGDESFFHLTALPHTVQRIVTLLRFPRSPYDLLLDNSS